MNRRNFLHSSALTLGALTLAQQKIFATMLDEPWKIKMLRSDVGVFTERGGTIAFLLSKKGMVVVDSQFPEQSQHLIDELKNQKNVAVAQKTEDKQLYPDQTFGETWCEKMGKEKICIHYHGTGHTDGDAIIHFEHALSLIHISE